MKLREKMRFIVWLQFCFFCLCTNPKSCLLWGSPSN